MTLSSQSVQLFLLLLFSGDALETNGKYLQRAAALSCGYRKHAHPNRRLTTSQKYERPSYRLHTTVKRDFDEFWKETLKVALLSAWTTIPLEQRSQMLLEWKIRWIYLFSWNMNDIIAIHLLSGTENTEHKHIFDFHMYVYYMQSQSIAIKDCDIKEAALTLKHILMKRRWKDVRYCTVLLCSTIAG